MIKKIIFFCTSLFIISCGGSDDGEPVNNAPSSVNLVYPTENLLCINNRIKFDWSDATDADKDPIRYKIIIARNRDLTNIIKEQIVNSSNTTITLQKGTAHYWNVTAIDKNGKLGKPSAVYAFYTKGIGIVNTAPFTAKLENPENQGNIFGSSITLKWNGSDSNTGDILKYDVFFGNSPDPKLRESNISDSSYQVTIESGKTYYWKVNTIDNSNAKSIGQVWSFTVN